MMGAYISVMAVFRLTGSGKALQVVLSEDAPAGSVFQVPYADVLNLRSRGTNAYSVASLLPFPMSASFPRSPIYGSSGKSDERYSSASKVQKVVEKKEGLKRSYGGVNVRL